MSLNNAAAVEVLASPEQLEKTDYAFTEDHLDRISIAKRLGFNLKLFVISEEGKTRLMALAIVEKGAL